MSALREVTGRGNKKGITGMIDSAHTLENETIAEINEFEIAYVLYYYYIIFLDIFLYIFIFTYVNCIGCI